jgi:hypothetical protein
MAAIDEQEKPYRDPALAARQLAAGAGSEAVTVGVERGMKCNGNQ